MNGAQRMVRGTMLDVGISNADGGTIKVNQTALDYAFSASRGTHKPSVIRGLAHHAPSRTDLPSAVVVESILF